MPNIKLNIGCKTNERLAPSFQDKPLKIAEPLLTEFVFMVQDDFERYFEKTPRVLFFLTVNLNSQTQLVPIEHGLLVLDSWYSKNEYSDLGFIKVIKIIYYS